MAGGGHMPLLDHFGVLDKVRPEVLRVLARENALPDEREVPSETA
jgi:hypothetical protein